MTYGKVDDVVELELDLAVDIVDVFKVLAALEDVVVTIWVDLDVEEVAVADVLDKIEEAAAGLYMYISSLLLAPQYSEGLPVQTNEQLEAPVRTAPALIVFPQ